MFVRRFGDFFYFFCFFVQKNKADKARGSIHVIMTFLDTSLPPPAPAAAAVASSSLAPPVVQTALISPRKKRVFCVLCWFSNSGLFVC